MTQNAISGRGYARPYVRAAVRHLRNGNREQAKSLLLVVVGGCDCGSPECRGWTPLVREVPRRAGRAVAEAREADLQWMQVAVDLLSEI